MFLTFLFYFCYSLELQMKKVLLMVFLVLAILAVGSVFLFVQKTNILGVVSPLADEKENSEQIRIVFDKKTTENYPPNEYFPPSLIPKYSDEIGINAQAYAVMDRDTKELLLAKNISDELPIASVTKIMTAVVALEKARLDVELRVTQQAAQIGEAEMGLTEGETVTVEELLFGLMLPSGNDAAETLAEGLGKGRSNFILSMNKKARELGMYDTFFVNPTGLDGETPSQSSFSSVLDLLALTGYALNNSTFADIAATHYKEFPYIEGKHKAFYLYNILQLDRSYPGIKGVKPGITDFANETLVSYAENGGRRIIIALLGTRNSRDEVVKLYDYVFSKLNVRITD